MLGTETNYIKLLPLVHMRSPSPQPAVPSPPSARTRALADEGRLVRGLAREDAASRREGALRRPTFGNLLAKCRSFSAVSAPIFEIKYAFFSIFQNLPDYLL